MCWLCCESGFARMIISGTAVVGTRHRQKTSEAGSLSTCFTNISSMLYVFYISLSQSTDTSNRQWISLRVPFSDSPPWKHPQSEGLRRPSLWFVMLGNTWWKQTFSMETLGVLNHTSTRPTSWWFQPLWKILVKNGSFPQIGVKIKNVWNHQLAKHLFWRKICQKNPWHNWTLKNIQNSHLVSSFASKNSCACVWLLPEVTIEYKRNNPHLYHGQKSLYWGWSSHL